MANTNIVPAHASIGFHDLVSQFEVCVTLLIDLPIIGGIRPPKVCANPTTLVAVFQKIVEIWGGAPVEGGPHVLAFEVGDVAALTADLTALALLPYVPIVAPDSPTGATGPDDPTFVLEDFGVTTP